MEPWEIEERCMVEVNGTTNSNSQETLKKEDGSREFSFALRPRVGACCVGFGVGHACMLCAQRLETATED